MMLEVEKINTFYGSSHILFDISLTVGKGEVVALLGRNGVGKTTTLHSLMGLLRVRSGKIKFEDKNITKMPPHRRAQLGIGFVPDNRRIFPALTVRQNLDMGRKTGRPDGRETWNIERVYDLFPVLRKMDSRFGRHLSGGEQQMLTIGRTLMGNPRLILMDEPAEGLAPLVIRSLVEQLMKLKEMGTTMLISEQNLGFALELSSRAYVIEKGVIRYHGSVEELSANEEVKRKYLMV